MKMEEPKRLKKCALCKEKNANKKNTHYLTDAVIRACLNYEGNNERERGFFFNISNDSHLVRFGFQRSTPPKLIERELKREPTEKEIEEAKENPYSVNDVFCSDCEALFGKIERPFLDVVYSKHNKIGLLRQYIANNPIITRLFFILQFWRSHACNTVIRLSPNTADEFRQIILHPDIVDVNLLKKYPMAVAFIESRDQKDYTSHFVGMASGKNPYVILMNDFVVQLFDSEKDIDFYPLYGLNDKETYKDYINYNEDSFIIQIIQEGEWHRISERYYISEIVVAVINRFINEYRIKYNNTPCLSEVRGFLYYYEENRTSLALTEEVFQNVFCHYIKYKCGIIIQH